MSSDQQSTGTAESWPLRDYTAPGLHMVRPDDAFPFMRPGDQLHHPWKYLRRDVPHIWYADERFPLMGFLNRDEATLLHNIALQFAGKAALEIGSWLGWSTCHLALAGVVVDVIDPAHEDAPFRAIVEESLARCGVADRVNLAGGRSPEAIAAFGRKWSLFFIDGDHESSAPLRDAMACLPFAEPDCAFVFHDLASPDVAAGLQWLGEQGFHVVVYQTAQIMGMAWRGDVVPVAHIPDPEVAWQTPAHLRDMPVSGAGFRLPPRTTWPQLKANAYPTSAAATQPNVCIVSNEIIGPFKNGGIGTAMTGLAELLASEGLRVTVLYTGGIWAPEVGLREWKRRYAALGIELVALSIEDMKGLAGPLKDRGFGTPWLVYQFLSERRFDIVHFNDCCGEGSLSLAAKKLGHGLRDSLLVVGFHSPSRWVLDLNQALPASLLLAAFDYAERLSVQCADVLWSPSRYLLGWATERGFQLPEQTFIQQYSIPSQRLREGAAAPASFPEVRPGRATPPREIVFFARLEERKGLRLFCSAIELLKDELEQRQITVTFLGKPERCAGIPSLDYIERRSSKWKFPVRLMTDLGQPEALQHLFGAGKLAVMPSVLDNSPCTVYEALCWGIPFLAARTGGTPELIHPADHEHVLFDHGTEPLRAALLEAITLGGWVARPSTSQQVTRRSWMAMHRNWRSFLPDHTATSPLEEDHSKPLRSWSVAAIVDHQGGTGLEATLQSIVQTGSIGRALVLNRTGGSVDVPAKMGHVALINADAETFASEVALLVEDAVLMIHSGVRIMPDRFDAMSEALQNTSIDGLLPAARISGTAVRIVPPLGGSPPFSLFEGATFTGAMLVRRESLLAAKTGRSLDVEGPFMGLADFCTIGNRQLWPYPEAVLEQAEQSMIDGKCALPSRLAAYDGVSPNDRYYMLAAGYGAVKEPVTKKRELALALVDLGLAPLVRAGLWSIGRARGLRLRVHSKAGSLIRWIRNQDER